MPPKKVKGSRNSRESSARRITKNTLFLGLSEAGARLSTWGLVAFLGRVWPVALYGQYAVAVNWVSIFAVLGELGLNALTVREVAHKRHQASFFLRHVLVIRSSFSFLFWAALIVLSWVLHYEQVLTMALGVMGLRLVLDSMEGGYIYLFQAHQEMAPYALVNLLCAAIRFLGIVLVVHAGAQIVGAGSVWTLASGVGFLLMMELGRRRGWKPDFARYRSEDSWKVIKMAVPLATFGALQTLYYRVDSVLLKSLSGNEAVGYYDMASRVLFVVLAVSQLYSQALYPAFASLKNKSKDFSQLAFQGGRVLFLLGLPISVGGYFLAVPILRLVGGPQYLPAGPAFAVLALSVLPFFLSMIYTDVLAVKDTKRLNIQFAILFVLNVLLNLIFIPRWGFVGAAWATVICEFLGVGMGFLLAAPYLNFVGSDWSFKPLLAGGISSMILGFGAVLWPSLTWILLGPLVYGLGLWLLGGVEAQEKKDLIGGIRRILGV
jgi:O-antigen/teichoic acid export membrane protein